MKVVCPSCGHEWERRTKSLLVKCPFCGKNFRLPPRGHRGERER